MKNSPCCNECRPLNSATAMMNGKPSVICAGEYCACHTPAGEAIQENLRYMNNGLIFSAPMTDKTIAEVVGKDNAFLEKDRKECQDFLDHNPQWCGDCFACTSCGLIFVSKEALRQQLLTLIDSAVDRIGGEKCDEQKTKAFGEWTAETYEEKMLANAALQTAITILQEMKK